MGLKVLVVDCLTTGDGQRIFTRDFIGAGPRFIAGFIEYISNAHFSTRLIRAEEILSERDLSWLSDYSIIALSAMTMDLKTVNKIISIWQKSQNKANGTLSLLGGPITTDDHILFHIPVDIAFIGEAESALSVLFKSEITELIQFLEIKKTEQIEIHKSKEHLIKKIPGIIYLDNNKITQSQIIYHLNDDWFINSSGFPEKIDAYDDYQQSRIYVECVRGCSNFNRTGYKLSHKKICQSSNEGNNSKACHTCRDENPTYLDNCPASIPPGCGFCSTIKQFGYLKSRNILKILDEVKILIKMGSRRIVLGGPDFLDLHREQLQKGKLINPNHPEPNYQALEQLIDNLLLIPAIIKHEVQLFIENVKPSLCTDRALDIIARIPSPIFSIGCETGSNKFANLLGRPSIPDKTFDAVKRAQNRGIRVHVYFIHSLPGDQAEYLEDTLKLMRKLAEMQVEKITLYKYQELPGSPFYQMPEPYVENPKLTHKLTEQLKRFVIQYNEQQKRNMIGKIFSVMVSEPNNRVISDAMGWILEGGPKITIKNGKRALNTIQKVKITQIISDRLVEGEII